MGYGPLVPFLSHKYNRDENDYALFMMVGSLFYVLGSIILKSIEKKISYHKGIICGYLVLGVVSLCFGFVDNFYVQALLYGLTFFGEAFVEVFSNTSIIEIYQNKTV